MNPLRAIIAAALRSSSACVAGWGASWMVLGLVGTAPAADRVAEAAAQAVAANLADHYGFAPLEVFKLEWRSHSMIAGDFNGDSRKDLAVVDNSHSRIDLLIQRDKQPDETDLPRTDDVNSVRSHWRFDHRKIPVDREIDAMIAGDFNGDGKLDLAYFGKPDRLVVRYQKDGDDWSEKWETRLADVEASAWSLGAGDLNHDGRDDLVVLGKQTTYVLLQKPKDGFEKPLWIRNTTEELRLAMIGDLDGDERNDLFYTASGNGERQICVRLQTPSGTLGPEYRLDIKEPLGMTLSSINADSRKDIFAIDSKTERLGLYRLSRPAAADEPQSRPIHYGVGTKGSDKRACQVGDIDGDGLTDIVISDPDSAQLILYRQSKTSGLDLGTSYPGYLGVEQLRMADLDGDGRAEVVVLSLKEKTVGVSRFDGERLTFPQGLAIEDEIIAFEMADLNSDGKIELVYISKPKSGGSKSKYLIKALTYQTDGTTQPHVFDGDKSEIEFEAKDVGRLTRLDANFDGRPDLLITNDLGRNPTLLVTNDKGIPEVVTGSGGVQLGDVEQGAVFTGQLAASGESRHALLISQGAFARRMKLGDDNRWQVLDQYNAVETGAKIKGAAILDVDGRDGPEIVLVDTGTGKLRVYRKDGELFQPWKDIELGTFAFQSLQVADFNGDKRDDLLLFGGTRFAVLYTGQSDPQTELLTTYESERDGAYLMDLAAGDLNNDGKIDLAVLENGVHAMEIVSVQPGPELKGVLSFKVFEEKSFHGRGSSGGMQPREILIADVTGDGRDDLILLAHDRILLYPQDDGTAPADAQVTAAEKKP